MWTKDDYQEHMLGYLSDVQAEIEQISHSSPPQHNFNELLTHLDRVSERLWWLIESNDADWEGFRYPLEARCDELLRALHRMVHAGSFKPSGIPFRMIRSSVYLNGMVVQHERETIALQQTLDG